MQTGKSFRPWPICMRSYTSNTARLTTYVHVVLLAEGPRSPRYRHCTQTEYFCKNGGVKKIFRHSFGGPLKWGPGGLSNLDPPSPPSYATENDSDLYRALSQGPNQFRNYTFKPTLSIVSGKLKSKKFQESCMVRRQAMVGIQLAW
jgi:hypothetical protein